MDINRVTLIGRLTRKPELEELSSGQKWSSFSLATNYIWRAYKTKKKRDTTQFHRVRVFGTLAEVATKYLDKGSRVYVEGRLHTGAKDTGTVIEAD